MARYIDAEKLIQHLKDEIEECVPLLGGRAQGKTLAYGTMLGLKSAISFVETLSEEDVVPKINVDMLKLENEALKREKHVITDSARKE